MLRFLTYTLSMLLFGCSSFFNLNDSQQTRLCATKDGSFHPCEDISIVDEGKSLSTQLTAQINFQLLAEYTEQMTVELQRNLNGKLIEDPIVVASFVKFNHQLQVTNSLGNYLAEFFINDLQNIGLPVSDHKLTGRLEINNNGTFALSSDADEVDSFIDVGYVLTGTMIENSKGVVVNARLINFDTNAVVASTTKLLPKALVYKNI